MEAENQIVGTPVHIFDALNYVAMDCLPRESEQRRRLHEPERLLTNIDPISGNDIADYLQHPYHTDGNVTMYFETEETRQAFLDMPVDHPFRLIDNPDDEGFDEG
jgi:YHS domain-containing protein